MHLFAELKRRKVFRTAAIYAASGWLLLQVAQLLLQMLDVPAWGLKLVFVLLSGRVPARAHPVLDAPDHAPGREARSGLAGHATGRGGSRTSGRRVPSGDFRAGSRRSGCRRQLDRGAALRQHERRPGEHALRRRPVRGTPEPVVAVSRIARRCPHVVVLVQGTRGERRDDCAGAQRLAPARRQRAQVRKSHSHHGAADSRHRQLPPVVAGFRSRPG